MWWSAFGRQLSLCVQMASYHTLECGRRCRVCGCLLKSRPSPAPANRFTDELLTCFGIDLERDEVGWAPTKLCASCTVAVRRSWTETKAGSMRETSITPVRVWPHCSGEDCLLCDQWRKDSGSGARVKGRGKRKDADSARTAYDVTVGADAPSLKKSRLRMPTPSQISHLLPSSCEGPAPQPYHSSSPLKLASEGLELSLDRFKADIQTDVFMCPVCRNVIDQPMEVPLPRGCQHVCCASCWMEWLSVSCLSGECYSGPASSSFPTSYFDAWKP